MKITDIMDKDFLFFEADDTVAFVAKKLVEKGQSEAPVVRQRKFIGMFLTSDLAALFVKDGLLGAKAIDAEKMRNDVVSKHIKSNKTWLDQDADLLSALGLLVHRNVDVIPVLDKSKRVIGVVHAADIRKEMSKVLNEGKMAPVRTQEKAEELEMLGGKTAIDSIVHYIQKKGQATAEEVAKNCNLTLQEVEEYAASLEKNGLLKVDYTILGKMKLRIPE